MTTITRDTIRFALLACPQWDLGAGPADQAAHRIAALHADGTLTWQLAEAAIIDACDDASVNGEASEYYTVDPATSGALADAVMALTDAVIAAVPPRAPAHPMTRQRCHGGPGQVRAAGRIYRAAGRCAPIACGVLGVLSIALSGFVGFCAGGAMYAYHVVDTSAAGRLIAACAAALLFLADRELAKCHPFTRWLLRPLRRILRDEMSDEDAGRWASARTLQDVGNLTALWLEGGLASQPGYAPGCGPDEETADLIPVLAVCNRAGFVTDGSQPGETWSAYDGARWEQRAAITGFASPEVVTRLCAAAGWDLSLQIREATRWRFSVRTAIPVTRREGLTRTRFGATLPRRHLRNAWTGYGICSRDAVREVCAAKQVTIVDLVWGRNDVLWPALERFAAQETESA